MPLDGLTLSRVTQELRGALIGGRIDRIQQPERDEINMIIRCGGENHRLLISASASHPRVHLTAQQKKSMDPPPQFCMLLRKHLLGGRVVDICQQGLDRVLTICVEAMDELGDYVTLRLTSEIMGKHSNLILCRDDGRIIDSARRVTAEMSRVRQVLPGLRYAQPPAQDKLDGRACTPEDICAALAARADRTLDKALLDSFQGLSGPVSRELAYRLLMDEKAPPARWAPLAASVAADMAAFFADLPQKTEPCVFMPGGAPEDVGCLRYSSRPQEEQRSFADYSSALDFFYAERDGRERIRQKSASLSHALRNALERSEKKLALQLERQQETARREEYRVMGELLMASLYTVRRGAKTAEVTDYYTEGMPTVTIPLDERLSPADNAQRYFKLYAKAKAAAELLVGQIAKNREEIDYLRGQMVCLDSITEEAELTEMRRELAQDGYVRADAADARRRGKPARIPPTHPAAYTAPDGTQIFVGKNNAQNERLTFGSDPDDLWLHAKNVPGSHVIVKTVEGQMPSDEALLMAAALAASHSAAKDAPLVPVDYTFRRWVKKPNGAKPGFVVYTHEWQVMVKPWQEQGD